MPRVMIDASDVWLQRYQQGVNDCIDTLAGLAIQCADRRLTTLQDAAIFHQELQDQLLDLKRNVESWRLIF